MFWLGARFAVTWPLDRLPVTILPVSCRRAVAVAVDAQCLPSHADTY